MVLLRQQIILMIFTPAMLKSPMLAFRLRQDITGACFYLLSSARIISLPGDEKLED